MEMQAIKTKMEAILGTKTSEKSNRNERYKHHQ